MALYARIKSVSQEIERYNPDTDETEIEDLSIGGQVLIVVDYIDSNNPSQILHTQNFQVSSQESEEQIMQQFLSFGANVRDSRIRASQLKQYEGQSFEIV